MGIAAELRIPRPRFPSPNDDCGLAGGQNGLAIVSWGSGRLPSQKKRLLRAINIVRGQRTGGRYLRLVVVGN